MTSRAESKLWAFLRFLNILEPRKKILSISKIFMWTMVLTVVYVLFNHPENITAVVAATGGQLIATMNYAFRRHTQFRMGEYDAIGNPSPAAEPVDVDRPADGGAGAGPVEGG